MPAVVKSEDCTACGICVDACPEGAIAMNDVAKVDADSCIDCGICVDECPSTAISME